MARGSKKGLADVTVRNGKVKVGVVGVGYLGRYHAMKYDQLPSADLVGVVDVDRQVVERVAKELNTAPYNDHLQFINKVDAVSIAVPTKDHHSIAMDFLKNGVDVLVEKPITKTIDEADELIEVAREKGAILQVGHLERFNAAVMALEDTIDEPMFIESHRLAPFKERGTDIDVILDLMIHDIDIILSLVGSEVVSINAVGVPVISDKVDIANARITFKSGCVANVTSSRVTMKQTRKIRIFQHNAYVSLDYANQKIITCKRIEEKGLPRPRIDYKEINVTKKDALEEELGAFINSVVSRKEPVVTGSDGRMALDVALKVQKGALEWEGMPKIFS